MISARDLRDLVSPRDVIDVLEEGFKELTSGNVIQPDRSRARIESHARFIVSSAYVGGHFDAFATKVVGVNYENPRLRDMPSITGTVVLNDPHTGELLAVIDGTVLTAIRTAACAALAAKHMSRKDAKCVGIFGAGAVGKELIRAFSAIREIEKIKVLSTSYHKSKTICEDASDELGIEIVPVKSPREVVVYSDIIGTATTSTEPLFDGEWLEKGTHISSVEHFHVIDHTTITRARKPIVVDLKDEVVKRAQDIVASIRMRLLSENDVVEIGRIILGEQPGRTNDTEITLFKTCGVAMEDVVTARRIYTLAEDKKIGAIMTL